MSRQEVTEGLQSCPQWISSTPQKQSSRDDTGGKEADSSKHVGKTDVCKGGEFLESADKTADLFDGVGTDALPAITKLEIRGCQKDDPVIGPVLYFKMVNKKPRCGERVQKGKDTLFS